MYVRASDSNAVCETLLFGDIHELRDKVTSVHTIQTVSQDDKWHRSSLVVKRKKGHVTGRKSCAAFPEGNSTITRHLQRRRDFRQYIHHYTYKLELSCET